MNEKISRQPPLDEWPKDFRCKQDCQGCFGCRARDRALQTPRGVKFWEWALYEDYDVPLTKGDVESIYYIRRCLVLMAGF